MEKSEKLPDFKDEQEIITFMEEHAGFELVDQGLAEIVETPSFQREGLVELDAETLQFLDELVAAGVCADMQDAVTKAVHSYVLAVLPQSYKLIREG